jgi:hypothetical protein
MLRRCVIFLPDANIGSPPLAVPAGWVGAFPLFTLRNIK